MARQSDNGSRGSGVLPQHRRGIVGAFVGGIIMNVIGKVGVTGFNFRSLLVAVVGAVILLGFVRLVGGGRGKRRFKNL